MPSATNNSHANGDSTTTSYNSTNGANGAHTTSQTSGQEYSSAPQESMAASLRGVNIHTITGTNQRRSDGTDFRRTRESTAFSDLARTTGSASTGAAGDDATTGASEGANGVNGHA